MALQDTELRINQAKSAIRRSALYFATTGFIAVDLGYLTLNRIPHLNLEAIVERPGEVITTAALAGLTLFSGYFATKAGAETLIAHGVLAGEAAERSRLMNSQPPSLPQP